MASEKLQRKLRKYVESLWAIYGRSNDMPRVVIGCEKPNYRAVDCSGPYPQPISTKLKKKLEEIGPLGSRGHKYNVGCCSEVRSSNQIMYPHPTINIDSLIFTNAIRPRTGQIKRRCRNCQHVFN